MARCEEMENLLVAKQSDKPAKGGFKKIKNDLGNPSESCSQVGQLQYPRV